MGFSLELHTDPVVEEAMRNLRDALKKRGVRGLELEYEYHPHVTLGYLEGEPSEVAYDVVRTLAATIGVVPFTVGEVGIFRGADTSVMYMSLGQSRGLSAAHELAVRLIEARLAPMGPLYQRERWVPHFTLGERIPNEDIPLVSDVVREVQHGRFPERGVLDRLALATDRPIVVVPMDLGRVLSLEGGFSEGIPPSHKIDRGR